MPKSRHIMAALAIGAAGPACAQAGFHDLAALDALVSANVGEGAARPVDRRLRLAACPDTPVIAAPVGGAVAVRCAARGWRIRVPLVAPPRAASAEPAIRRGERVTVVVEMPAFTLSTSGIASESGPVGARIAVRVEGRATPLIGEILPDGRIAANGI